MPFSVSALFLSRADPVELRIKPSKSSFYLPARGHPTDCPVEGSAFYHLLFNPKLSSPSRQIRIQKVDRNGHA